MRLNRMNGEEPTSPIAERPMADLGGKTRPRRRWRRLALAAVIVALVGAGLLFAAYRYNNHPRTSDAALAEGLALAIERGQGWVQQHPDMLLRQTRNVALFYMLQDMDRLNPTQLYGRLVAEFLDAPASPGFWKRMLDPDRRVWAGPMNHALTEANLDNRWLIFALNPDGVKLNPAQETSLFDPERWENRRLAHQLWALYHLRRVSADPRATDELIDRLCRRIAEENALDIRVNDLYCERVAFS